MPEFYTPTQKREAEKIAAEYNKPLGNVTLTVEFEIHATSVREAEKCLDNALRSAEDDDQLKQYEVVKTEWESR